MADKGRKKVLFITPPYHCGVVEVAGRWVPLTLAYLAGSLREAGFEPVIYDAMTKRHGFQEIEEKIIKEKPDYVATTAITSTAFDAYEILRIAKDVNQDIITLIGGVHPTFMFSEALHMGYCDYVIRGEGELALRDLLLSIEGGGVPSDIKGIAYKHGHRIIITPPRCFIEDLDSLPVAWDLIEWEDYCYFVIPKSRLGAVSTSRGCNHNCTFCSQQKFWQQTWRGRSPESVVAEFEHLYRSYGVNVFLIPDEYPTRDRQRWEKILDMLIERHMPIYILMETRAEDIIRDSDILHKYKRAGIIHIYIGVEATRQETLDMIKKDIKVETGIEAIRLIHEHGMITETSFILGFPDENGDSISRTLELARSYNPDFAHFLALAPWPYADMYEDLMPYIIEKDFRRYNLIEPVIKPDRMSLKELDEAIINCYQKFYMGKMGELMSMKDEFKRQYLLRSMRLMMNSSFIVEKLGRLGTIPQGVNALIRGIESTESERIVYTPRVSRSITINAPIEKVFSFISSPDNWHRFIPGLMEIRNVSDEPLRSGTTFEWTYRIKGINLRGEGTVIDYKEGERMVLQMHSLMPIRKTLTFRPLSNKTVLSVEVGFMRGGKVLSMLFIAIARVVNLMQTVSILREIKEFCEQGHPNSVRHASEI
jgi:anaerobic magnesium-protoporphyrin IX monomethyl ester cyclase